MPTLKGVIPGIGYASLHTAYTVTYQVHADKGHFTLISRTKRYRTKKRARRRNQVQHHEHWTVLKVRSHPQQRVFFTLHFSLVTQIRCRMAGFLPPPHYDSCVGFSFLDDLSQISIVPTHHATD